jgi:hypothetical protein
LALIWLVMFVLLARGFRSVVLAAKAIALNVVPTPVAPAHSSSAPRKTSPAAAFRPKQITRQWKRVV